MTRPGPAVVDLLRSRGLRVSRARQLLLGRLLRTRCHPTAYELERELRRAGRRVGVATVYQNLKALADAGLVASFADAAGLVRFEANIAPHSHLVCTACGRIEDVAPARAQRPVRRLRGWTVTGARLELRGRCPRCRPQSRSGAAKTRNIRSANPET